MGALEKTGSTKTVEGQPSPPWNSSSAGPGGRRGLQEKSRGQDRLNSVRAADKALSHGGPAALATLGQPTNCQQPFNRFVAGEKSTRVVNLDSSSAVFKLLDGDGQAQA
jgi:hypothetical protein